MAVSQSLTLTQISQDVAANTSQVRILWQSTQTGDSYNGYTRKATWWLRTNGGGWTAYSVYYTLPQNTTATIVDTVVTVSHDTQGKCTLDVATRMETGISAGTVELEKSLTLADIPRYSVLSASDAIIGGNCLISITKQDAAFRHSLRYSLTGQAPWTYLDASGQVAPGEVIFSSTTVNFLVPELFYWSIPESPTGTCTLELWTYITDKTYLPEPRTATFTYKADPALSSPEISCTVQDTNQQTLALTGDDSVLIRYKSNARMVLEEVFSPATHEKGVAVQYMGQWHYGREFDFPQVQSDYFTLWLQDSRGYETYREHTQPGFVPYVLLTNQTVPKRRTPTGSEVDLTVSGSCYVGNFGGSRNIENAVRVWYRIAQNESQLTDAPWQEVTPQYDGNSYTVTVALPDIPYDQSRWVETWAEDQLEAVTRRVKIGRGLPVFDWGENDFRFHVPVTFTASDGTAFTLDLVDGQLAAKNM